MIPPRIPVKFLTLSAAALVTLVLHENYTDTAVVPVKGDRLTIGFGSTFKEDGAPVQKGDTTTPPKALARTLHHIGKDEANIKQCVTAPLYQAEYDLMENFAYQYGTVALCSGDIVAKANAGDYAGSCKAYLNYKYMTSRTYIKGWEEYKPSRWRFNCATPENRVCAGVWARSLWRYQTCIGAAK